MKLCIFDGSKIFRNMHFSMGKCFFFGRRPLPFGGPPLEAYPWTSGESNHHRQSVRVAKNDALPTDPRGHLFFYGKMHIFLLFGWLQKCIFHISLILSKNQGFHGIMHFGWL